MSLPPDHSDQPAQPNSDTKQPVQSSPSASTGIDDRVRIVMILVACASMLISMLVVANRLNNEDEESSGTGSSEVAGGGSSNRWQGTPLEIAVAKPDIQLTDTDGNPYSLLDATEGQLTILTFGYTNCPDVCPISMATLGQALKSLPPETANRVRVVFVTADPERDTPEVLSDYLGNFHQSFTGLVGTVDEIDAAQALIPGIPIAVREKPDKDGNYAVGHTNQIFAFQGDGWARISYSFETRQEQWKRDIPRLLAGEFPT